MTQTRADRSGQFLLHQRNHHRTRQKPGLTRILINQFGTDFRYAVEFSKNGRTPFRTFRSVLGQPDLRYGLLLGLSNPLPDPTAPALRRGPTPTPAVKQILGQNGCSGLFHSLLATRKTLRIPGSHRKSAVEGYREARDGAPAPPPGP